MEALSKFESYEGEMLNEGLTSLLTDCHFDHLVSEDCCHSTFIVNTEVIWEGYQNTL